jgi:hypothetical protein
MGYSSSLLTPDCTPSRAETVEASTPCSDILLEELQTAIQSDPASSSRRCGVANIGACRTCLRSQSRILWLAILVVVGILLAVRMRENAASNESQLLAQANPGGLQFIGGDHPSIRVRQLANLTSTQLIG